MLLSVGVVLNAWLIVNRVRRNMQQSAKEARTRGSEVPRILFEFFDAAAAAGDAIAVMSQEKKPREEVEQVQEGSRRSKGKHLKYGCSKLKRM